MNAMLNYAMQKWKFGSNFTVPNWVCYKLPPLQESRPEIPKVEEREGNMATPIFKDLLDPTMIFLVAEHKVTSMTCRGGGNEQNIDQVDRQVFSKG